MIQKRRDLRFSHLGGRPFIVEQDKAASPIHVTFFGGEAVVVKPQNGADLIEQFRLARGGIGRQVLGREARKIPPAKDFRKARSLFRRNFLRLIRRTFVYIMLGDARAHSIMMRYILILLLLPVMASCDSRSIQEQAFDDDVMLSAPKMQALLDKGLDPNTRLGPPATSEFLLWRAVKLRRTDTVRLLLSRGAKPDERSSGFRKTPLFQAAFDGSRDICILLLDHGADPNALDDSSNNPLREAILGKKPTVVSLLLERGSRPQQTNSDKLTMADIAAKYGNLQIQKLFAQ
jgi:hypothetical protein